MNKAIVQTYNFSPTFAWFVPHYAAEMLHRNYSSDTANLNDLCVHGGIEHDASLTSQYFPFILGFLLFGTSVCFDMLMVFHVNRDGYHGAARPV